jgi:hypothetical protein
MFCTLGIHFYVVTIMVLAVLTLAQVIMFGVCAGGGSTEQINFKIVVGVVVGIACLYQSVLHKETSKIVRYQASQQPLASVVRVHPSPVQGPVARTMQVAVPPGAPPGTTLQVQTPDGLIIQVQVPPNCKGCFTAQYMLRRPVNVPMQNPTAATDSTHDNTTSGASATRRVSWVLIRRVRRTGILWLLLLVALLSLTPVFSFMPVPLASRHLFCSECLTSAQGGTLAHLQEKPLSPPAGGGTKFWRVSSTVHSASIVGDMRTHQRLVMLSLQPDVLCPAVDFTISASNESSTAGFVTLGTGYQPPTTSKDMLDLYIPNVNKYRWVKVTLLRRSNTTGRKIGLNELLVFVGGGDAGDVNY